MTGAGPIFTLHHTDESPGEHPGAGVIRADSSDGTHLPTATGTNPCSRLATTVPRLLSWEQGGSEHCGCCRRDERGVHHRLLLRQCFKRRFWLPLHFVRNLILSACAVSSCMPTAASSPAGPGAAAAPLGEQSAGSGPGPLERPVAPAHRECCPGTQRALPRHPRVPSRPRALLPVPAQQPWRKGHPPGTAPVRPKPAPSGTTSTPLARR